MYFFLRLYNLFLYFSLCDDLENVTPRVTTAISDYQKLDSVSKENLWLKLGKEIYRRQVNIFLIFNLYRFYNIQNNIKIF